MAAQKGNKYAEGNSGGRPAIYSDPGVLQANIEEYFAQPEGKKTITGLAYHLGFESRQSLYDYVEKHEFAYIIKRARLRVEIMYEESLSTTTPTGAIFALKNMGWQDKLFNEVTGKDGEPFTVTLNLNQ